MPKISVYVTESEKQKIAQYAAQSNMTISQYLLHKGLGQQIVSDRMKAQIASVACMIYLVADELERSEQREAFKELGEKLYGILEDPS